MNLDNLIKESVEGMSLYLQYKVAKEDIAAGIASPTQKVFVSSYHRLVAENKAKAALQQMKAEAALIEKQQQIFEDRWGFLLGGKG